MKIGIIASAFLFTAFQAVDAMPSEQAPSGDSYIEIELRESQIKERTIDSFREETFVRDPLSQSKAWLETLSTMIAAAAGPLLIAGHYEGSESFRSVGPALFTVHFGLDFMIDCFTCFKDRHDQEVFKTLGNGMNFLAAGLGVPGLSLLAAGQFESVGAWLTVSSLVLKIPRQILNSYEEIRARVPRSGYQILTVLKSICLSGLVPAGAVCLATGLENKDATLTTIGVDVIGVAATAGYASALATKSL